MLWQIQSGDLDVVIESDKENLSENIIKAIIEEFGLEACPEGENSSALAVIIHARRLTGWPNSTTLDELENEDVFYNTEALLRKFNKWQD